MSKYRWLMLSLLFMVTTVNYLDRNVIGIILPAIREDLDLSTEAYGMVTTAFQVAYMVGYLLAGKFIDWAGTRIGYGVAIVWWSIAAVMHGFANGAFGLGVFRFLLGLGESGNFPAAIKAVAEWFPKKDRAFATGIFNAGTNVATMIGPPLFAWMVLTVGWRQCFIITGAFGFIWVFLWFLLYRTPQEHKGINQEELDYITKSDPEEAAAETVPAVGWSEAIRHRETWGFALAKFFTDPVWWFYLFWLPPYLYDVRGFDIKAVGWALPVVYIMADIGSVFGGWFSGFLMRRGMASGKARKTAMLSMAVCMPVAAMSALVPDAWMVIALVSLATAAHQGWSANLFTTTSDVFPRRAVASVTGIGGSVGGLGGVLFTGILPTFIVSNLGYEPMILIMGAFHLIALLCVHLLMRNLEPVTLSNN
jgi:ACS family hexuronate transporter-like MFS transporter